MEKAYSEYKETARKGKEEIKEDKIMSMKITQEFMEDYVINPMAKRFADLEKQLDVITHNIHILINKSMTNNPQEPKLASKPKPIIKKKVK